MFTENHYRHFTGIVWVLFLLWACNGEVRQKNYNWSAEYLSLPYKVQYNSPAGADYRTAVDSIIRHLTDVFSHRSDSAFMHRVNATADKVWISQEVKPLLDKTLEISKATDGAFDVTIVPFLELAREMSWEERLSDTAMLEAAKPYVGYSHLTLYCEETEEGAAMDCYLHKDDARVRIDLGGIYKGYIADCLADFFRQREVQDYYVEIGKTPHVRCSGQMNYDWSVVIREPSFDTVYTRKKGKVAINLNRKGLACSGKDSEFFIRDGQIISKYISPYDGRPVSNNLLSVVVIAEEAATADALATAFIVMGREKAMQYIDTHPDIEAYFIYKDADDVIRTEYSSGLQEQIQEL